MKIHRSLTMIFFLYLFTLYVVGIQVKKKKNNVKLLCENIYTRCDGQIQ